MITSPEFEAFLARIYVDKEFRTRFLADPSGEAKRAGLSAAEGLALENIDRDPALGQVVGGSGVHRFQIDSG